MRGRKRHEYHSHRSTTSRRTTGSPFFALARSDEAYATQMTYYERNLPHWHPAGKIIFLTWRLHGSLPSDFLLRLASNTESPGKQFLRADRRLDQSSSGPLWLQDPAIAECVYQAIQRGAHELHCFAVHAFVIMPNHVHLLLEPQVPLAQITNGLKGAAAREANRILGRTGHPFWQQESFDHWIRDAAAYRRTRAYIEQNPVRAGLAARPEDWPWSSASNSLRIRASGSIGIPACARSPRP